MECILASLNNYSHNQLGPGKIGGGIARALLLGMYERISRFEEITYITLTMTNAEPYIPD